MAQFSNLIVTAVEPTTRDAVVVTLARADGGEIEFSPGQYLTFRRDFDGVELRRSYSICSGPGEPVRIGIKRVKGGAFSGWANDRLSVGDMVGALDPMGQFAVPPALAPRHVLLIAAGSGITPILSVLRALMTKPDTRVTLIYANRNLNTIMFREELEDLKNRHMGRLSILHILSGGQDIPLFSGRIDDAKIDALFASWIDPAGVDLAMICGPEALTKVIVAGLKRHGIDPANIRYELFGSAQPGRLIQTAARAEKQKPTAATVTLDGAALSFDMERDQSVLDAAIAAGLDAPFACKAGVCSTCRCRVIEGEVEMAANHALEDYEVARGFVLSCQSYPLTDRVVVDYDQH